MAAKQNDQHLVALSAAGSTPTWVIYIHDLLGRGSKTISCSPVDSSKVSVVPVSSDLNMFDFPKK